MKQNKLAYAHGKVINIYIVYELKNRTVDDDFTVSNELFGAVKITKDPSDSDNNKYSGYGYMIVVVFLLPVILLMV